MYEVWMSDASAQPIAAALAVLSQEEQRRASDFIFPADRARFVVAHALKRLCLAEKLDRTAPETLHFATLSFGKPILVGETPRCHFSLSHSGEGCAVAVSDSGRCGVDIELLERKNALPEALRRTMTPSEWRAVEKADDHKGEFMQRWALKEAYAKWIGLGLHLQFESLCTEQIHWIDRAFGSFEGTPCWRITSGPFVIAACGKGLAAMHRVSRRQKAFALPAGRYLHAHCYEFSH